ncbi:MAG: hypothetical protein U0441_06960 [Polyangiaceae bacterium]
MSSSDEAPSPPPKAPSEPTVRRVIARFALFCLPIVIVLGATEVGMRRVDNSYRTKLRSIEARKNDLQVLVTGSSTGLFGVDPSLFSAKGYNVATVSQTAYYDDAFVRPQIQEMPKLKLVMVVLSTPSLEMRLGEGPEYWRQFWYEHFWGIAPEIAKGPFDARHYSLAALYPRAVELPAASHGFKYDAQPGINAGGFLPVETDGHQVDDAHGIARAAYHKSIMRPENIPINLGFFTNLLTEAKSRGVTTTFLLAPVSRYYRAHRDPEALARIESSLAELRGKGAQTANYLDDPRFSDEHFGDPDHLNPKGAAVFSKILDEEIVKPALVK